MSEGVGSYSSDINLDDYREFSYSLPVANKNASGVLEYTSTGGTFAGYRQFAIRIDMLSPSIHKVPTIRDYRALALT
jgi:hypothetical protein